MRFFRVVPKESDRIWKNAKEKVHQNDCSGLVLVVCGVENESELMDKDLLERFKDENLVLRHVSFKFSTKEDIINSIRTYFHRENQLRFEVLEGFNIEGGFEYEGEKVTIG